jgi:FkbH-like protein
LTGLRSANVGIKHNGDTQGAAAPAAAPAATPNKDLPPPDLLPSSSPELSLSALKREAVRLVIWDLDETFWKGTLSEGGIGHYLQANHDIVVTLAHRGIMSSICSRNDFATVRDVLERHGIWDYFIFPSIDWNSKGRRVADIVETVQLRPPTILFIDDNPMNLADVAVAVPGIQVAGPEILEDLLDDPLFEGKNDERLTRLSQYKLLEKRQSDK